MPITQELEDIIKRAVSPIIDGMKRVDIDSPYWKVTAQRLVTTIRVDIKAVNRIRGGQ